MGLFVARYTLTKPMSLQLMQCSPLGIYILLSKSYKVDLARVVWYYCNFDEIVRILFKRWCV